MVLARPQDPTAARLGPIAVGAPVSLDAARSLLRGLNREQRRAVTHGEGPALVIAGPGTGKTEVVTRRVAWLIATKRARPRDILALTFTDNAAHEMQARVDVLVPYGQADAAIHTFHAFGDRLLREHSFELGLPSDVRLLSRRELIVFLREHLFELGLDRYLPLGDPTRFLGALIDMFGRAKDEDIGPDELAAHAQGLAAQAASAEDLERAALVDIAAARAEIAVAFERYGQLLAANGLIDHADQVALALCLLRTRPSIRHGLAERYRYIVVDELQDTNRAQLELVLALTGERHNVIAVGDPAQGIYGFRGARTGNVARFETALPRTRTIALRRNYRSLAPILASAQRLRWAAGESGADGLTSAQVAHRRRRGRAVEHVSYPTPEAEADGVALEIKRLIDAGTGPADVAVLVRSNGEADEVVRSLRARGVPVATGARAGLFANPKARALLAFLRVVADPSDSVELFTLASGAPYHLTGDHLGALLNGARRRNRSLWEALLDVAQHGDDRLGQPAIETVRLLVGHVTGALQRSAEMTSGALLYEYLVASGWLAHIARADDAAAAAEARSVARLCTLVRARAALLAEDRVQFLAAQLNLDEPDDEADVEQPSADAVSVLTVHRAKGLEFAIVFICGLVDGRFPVKSRPAALALPNELLGLGSEDGETLIAEERRLFYVALTRARDEVRLSSHASGRRGKGRRRPSIFIAEALDILPTQLADVTRPLADSDLRAVLVDPPPLNPAAPTRATLSLSYSQVDEYLTCPERYRLHYEIGIPTPPHHLLSYGSAIHQAIAAFHAAQAAGRTLSEAELVDALARSWRPEGFLSREHEEARFAAGRDALLRFRGREIAAGGSSPWAVERPFSFRLGADQIRGRVDRIDIRDGGAVITDYKSSDVRDQARADAKARDSLQLQIYALAHEAETGELPQLVQLHFVETGVIGSAPPDRKRLDKARQKVVAAADAIRAGDFNATPGAIACGYCPFRTICAASVARAA